MSREITVKMLDSDLSDVLLERLHTFWDVDTDSLEYWTLDEMVCAGFYDDCTLDVPYIVDNYHINDTTLIDDTECEEYFDMSFDELCQKIVEDFDIQPYHRKLINACIGDNDVYVYSIDFDEKLILLG